MRTCMIFCCFVVLLFCCFVVLFFFVCEELLRNAYAYLYRILLFCCFILFFYCFFICMWSAFEECVCVRVWYFVVLLFCFFNLYVKYFWGMRMHTHIRFCCFVVLLFFICMWSTFEECVCVRVWDFVVLLFCCFIVFLFVCEELLQLEGHNCQVNCMYEWHIISFVFVVEVSLIPQRVCVLEVFQLRAISNQFPATKDLLDD